MAESEIARLLHQIDLEYQAAKWGLTGLAYGTSQHHVITTKMENMGKTFETLTELVGSPEETIKMVNDTLKDLPDRPTRCDLVDFLRRTCDQTEETTTLIEQIEAMWNTISLLGERFGLDVARKIIEAPSSFTPESEVALDE